MMTTRLGSTATLAVVLAAMTVACEPAAEGEEDGWVLAFDSTVDSLDLGHFTYQDTLPTSSLQLTNASGVPLVVRSVTLEGYGAQVFVLSGAPQPETEMDDDGMLNLTVAVTDQVEWQTGWYTPDLVVTAASAKRGDADLPDQTWSLPVLVTVRCDIDGDGYDALVCGGTDCADDDAEVHPGAEDTCNDVDDDCDGELDEIPDLTWYVDGDGDGYGAEDETTLACDQPSGFVDNTDDCDDEDADVHPGADEYCNDEDDDCDGDTDESPAVDATTWYLDADGDGWGGKETIEACELPEGYVEGTADCDDDDPLINPGIPEACDGVDQDCDGDIDEDPMVEGTMYFLDADGDGYGSADDHYYACDAPTGYVDDATDCDDDKAGINPGAIDDCGAAADGVDDDCDGVVDNTDALETFFRDADADGYGDPTVMADSCTGTPPGYVSDDTDCDDGNPANRPGAPESCGDAQDNDCDGLTDCEDDECDFEMPCSFDLVNADATLYGTTTGDQAGLALCGAGLVDGDLYGDILISAPLEDSNGANAGAVYLLSGPVTGILPLSSYDAVLLGTTAGDQAGTSVGSAGDFNGDGYDDIIVGAPDNADYASAAGAAYLLFGPVSGSVDLAHADMILNGTVSSDEVGSSVVGVGDTNGDGLADVLIGAPQYDGGSTNGGAAFVLLGGTMGPLEPQDVDGTLLGDASSDLSGVYVGAAGDLDADGYDDMIVGASGYRTSVSNAGAVYLVHGPVLGEIELGDAEVVIEGNATSDALQRAQSADLNGDGTLDLVAGTEYADVAYSSDGAVYAFLGSLSGTVAVADADATLHGPSSTDYVGSSLATLSDVDGDGQDEALVGAWGANYGPTNSGSAFLLGWPWSGSTIDEATVPLGGITANDHTGQAVSNAGDVDGDGFDDMLIGAPAEDSGGSSAGAAYLVLGHNFQ